MPFRCKCGRTFEKTDTFSTHTSACASFHHRRMSDTAALQSHQQQQQPYGSSLPTIYSTPLNFTSQSSTSSMASSPGSSNGDMPQQLSSSPPLWMPTGISIQNAFEGARRRSMSYGSTFK